MFEKLVVAVDISTASVALVQSIRNMAALGTKEILLLQCVSINDITSVSLTYSLEYIDRNLHHLKNILTPYGYAVETRIVPGSPRSEVFHVAVRENYSAIVVGAQKYAAAEMFFGGLAYDLIHHAPKPVLIARLKDPALAESEALDFGKHVLLPTDFSENAELAFEEVQKLGAGNVRKVTLLHVQDQSRIGKALEDMIPEYNEVDGARLDIMKKKLQKATSAEVNTMIRFGSPAVEILKTVKDYDVQLVVMGCQGRGYVQELFLGGVSHNIARHADTSVVLVPAKRHHS